MQAICIRAQFLKNVKIQQNYRKIISIRKIFATNSSAIQIALTINIVLPSGKHTGIGY